MTAPPSVAAQVGSAIAGAPFAPSSDTDGTGTASGSISGNAPGNVYLNNGVISGGPGGSFSAASSYYYDGKGGTFYNSWSGSGTFSDGTTFTVGGGVGTFVGTVSGNTVTGSFHGSGTGSDGDAVIVNGTFQGTVDQNGNITGGTFTATISDNDNVWEPVANGDYLWSDYKKNWSAGIVPVSGDTATFDGEFNSQCIVDVATTESNLVLQNGFAAPFQIQGNGANLDIPAYDDSNNAGGEFYVNFLAASSVVTYDGAVVTEKKKVDFETGGKVNLINGASVTFDGPGNVTQQSGSAINVTNGQLIFGDNKNSGNYSTFKLTNASADINIGGSGSLTLYQTGTTEIDNSANPGAVISNNGKATLQGVTGAGKTTISVPLQNHSTLNITGGTWSFTLSDTSGNDLFMDAGSINLNNNANVTCAHKYTQTGGVFNIMDASETFNVSAGAANFNGGTVQFTNSTGNGVLNTQGIVFNGATLNMRIWGNSTTNDQIVCNGNCTIQGSSTINVTMVGNPTQTELWTLIQVKGAGNTLTGDFKTVNLPDYVYEDKGSSAWGCDGV